MKRVALWRPMSIVALFLLTISVLQPVPAAGAAMQSAIKTFDFTGTIITVSGTPFGLSSSLGQQVQGSFMYDTNRAPAYDTGSVAGYVQPPPSGMALVISGVSFHSQDYNSFQVVNDAYGFDNLNGYFTPITVDGASFPGSISFNLVDWTQKAFTNTALPSVLKVDNFAYRIGSLFEDPTTSTGPFLFFRIDTLTIPVVIDVKPGSFPNSINPKSHGVVPVAILSTDTFAATSMNASAVRFGAIGTESAPAQSAREDVDGDGDMDMILHFNTQATGIQCGTTSVSLVGKTVDGQTIKGTDTIATVGCW